MFVDLHAHTGGISTCCKVGADKILETAKEYGFDGLAIANHYVRNYFTGETYGSWIEKYIAEWNLCMELGKEYGLRIFKAVEVTMEYDKRLHMLIYGADEAFLRNNPFLCDKSLAELYGICKENGCALIQAHPFRYGATVQDSNFLDGIEINCHPNYQISYADRVMEIAQKKNLIITVGCDYHADNYRPRGGVFLPEELKDEKDLANYLLTAEEFHFQVHEPQDDRIYQASFRRETQEILA